MPALGNIQYAMKIKEHINQARVRYCHFGISPVNYSDFEQLFNKFANVSSINFINLCFSHFCFVLFV